MRGPLAWMPIALVSTFLLISCKGDGEPSVTPGNCFSGSLLDGSGSSGFADVFSPDPMIGAGRLDLAPGALRMDDYRARVTLSRLGGRGVLEGQYVDVRDGLNCKGGFSAFSENNAFTYSHSDFRFQAAMAYFFGDEYRATLDGAGYLQPLSPVKIVVHCSADNNAYYIRYPGLGGLFTGEVCLGNSTFARNTSYADDAAVIIHELQHATTVDTYSLRENLNQFDYDEAGALNEGISDFMAVMFLAPSVRETPPGSSKFDPKVFSRWALGTYLPNQNHSRGVHRCPAYDADYPRCAGFPGFSSKANTLSYVYPDGLGWPHARSFPGPGYLRSTFQGYGGQEDIHTTGIVISGALWDVYEDLELEYGHAQARERMTKAILQAVSELPKPTLLQRSSVTFRGFIENFLQAAPAAGFTAEDIARAETRLEARGLYRGELLEPGWAAAGPGDVRTPGMKIHDHPTELKVWLTQMGADPSVVTQTSATLNGRLNAGEVAALWFDIENQSEITAGGVYLKVRSQSPWVTFLDVRANSGIVSESEAHIVYSKINGQGIVKNLHSLESAFFVPTGNSYFKTNPFFHSRRTALWVRVAPGAPKEPVGFTVEALPSNGAASIVDFETRIY